MKYLPSGNWSPGTFREIKLAVETFRDGSDDKLLEPLHYRAKDLTEYRCPSGSRTDGMSLPKPVRMVPGFDANRQDWFSAILHDQGYRGTLEKWDANTQTWKSAKLSRRQTDQLMIESLSLKNPSPKLLAAKRQAVYWPLRAFGWPNFKPAGV